MESLKSHVKSYIKANFIDNYTLTIFQLCAGIYLYQLQSSNDFRSLLLVFLIPVFSYILNEVIFSRIYSYIFPEPRYITKWVSYIDGDNKEQILVSVKDNSKWKGWKNEQGHYIDNNGHYLMTDDIEYVEKYIKEMYSQENGRNGVKEGTEIRQGLIIRRRTHTIKFFNNKNPFKLFSNYLVKITYYLGYSLDIGKFNNDFSNYTIVQFGTDDMLKLKTVKKYRYYDLNDISWQCALLQCKNTSNTIEENDTRKKKLNKRNTKKQK